jgi:hypothetical protein
MGPVILNLYQESRYQRLCPSSSPPFSSPASPDEVGCSCRPEPLSYTANHHEGCDVFDGTLLLPSAQWRRRDGGRVVSMERVSETA